MRGPLLSHTMQDMNAERAYTSYLICLRGKLPDQAALLGILFRIHNLNLQILLVRFESTKS